ncbi:hypothetical protein QTU67_000246 [Vibrio cholerae]|uniref:hypothetical protein n=1 Tax=Vibrio cholerae TaxID=666 RepID=UPI002932F9D7|nr:hypothetical protein [Vibrio cholerae]EHS1100573.1 hypothetical protein [Vibrio cholerae]EIC2297115.1 hypothetical protein [Vibrio cholerae]EJL6912305.1 hypothetical protein [Vibrio cholerae]ELP8146036.1 hypothetical protein [Vibrio cholerae]MEB5557199.1 hypothetical protein [Vibrio cholerae]
MTNDFLESVVNPVANVNLNIKEQLYSSLIVESSLSLIMSGCPILSEIIKSKPFSFYEDFISWCYVNSKETDWRLAISFFEYLNSNEKHINHDILMELIFLACSQWTYSNKSSKNTLIIFCSLLENYAFGSKKSQSAEEFREVFYFETSHLNTIISREETHLLFMYWELENDSHLPSKPGIII